MKKINIKTIFDITKDILAKTCIYFSCAVILLNIAGKFFNNTTFAQNILGTLYLYDAFAQSFVYMLFLASFFAGAAAQIFKIKKLPAISRHIAFFILLYLDFLLVIIPFSNYTITNDGILLLSVAFVIIYLIIFGIVMGIRAIINYVRNKNLKYEKQFKNAK